MEVVAAGVLEEAVAGTEVVMGEGAEGVAWAGEVEEAAAVMVVMDRGRGS